MDDCIFYTKKSATIDNIILSLKDEFLPEKEEDMAGFLGIQINCDDNNNTLTTTQTSLIDNLSMARDMKDCNLKYTHTDKDQLCKDEDGVSCCEN